MGSRNIFSFIALSLAFALAAAFFSGQLVQAETICGLHELDSKCRPFLPIKGPYVDASPACCDVIHHVDLLCFCRNATPQVEKYLSMDKLAYVAYHCGRPLPTGIKCGSFTVPLA